MLTVSCVVSSINDVNCHIEGAVHQQKYKDSQGCASISSMLVGNQQQRLIHASNVLSAEIRMAQFIAVHNLPFQVVFQTYSNECSQIQQSRLILHASAPRLKQYVMY